MPVTVESSAASACSAGSSARASAPLSQRRPSTPLAAAAPLDARAAARPAPALAATTSLPQRRWPTPRASQYGYSSRRPATHRRRLQRAGRVVEAGVDDLAVARAGAVADARRRPRGRASRGRAAPARARTARPTTPAPTTTASSRSSASSGTTVELSRRPAARSAGRVSKTRGRLAARFQGAGTCRVHSRPRSRALVFSACAMRVARCRRDRRQPRFPRQRLLEQRRQQQHLQPGRLHAAHGERGQPHRRAQRRDAGLASGHQQPRVLEHPVDDLRGRRLRLRQPRGQGQYAGASLRRLERQHPGCGGRVRRRGRLRRRLPEHRVVHDRHPGQQHGHPLRRQRRPQHRADHRSAGDSGAGDGAAPGRRLAGLRRACAGALLPSAQRAASGRCLGPHGAQQRVEVDRLDEMRLEAGLPGCGPGRRPCRSR